MNQVGCGTELHGLTFPSLDFTQTQVQPLCQSDWLQDHRDTQDQRDMALRAVLKAKIPQMYVLQT